MEHRVISQTLDLERSFVEPVVKAASVDNADVESTVNEKVDELMQSLSVSADSKSQISLCFTETKPRRAWFSKSEEEICWEEWTIYVNAKVHKTERGNVV
ncbi:hypothetical protein LPJ63_002808 [Coemansia sp. RSA 2711]|nr:hypothetical protein LPJ63_002808 [Coemansia sp. RSA 2711]